MENQTRFDLNAALERWRQEFGSQSYVTPDHQRELEAHLRDSLAELKARGLNDEESFILARRRIGQPHKLAEEFVKADPAAVWRERVFWFVFGFLVLRLWNVLTVTSALPILIGTGPHIRAGSFKDLLPDWVMNYVPQWLQQLAVNTLFNAVVFLSAMVWFAMVVLFASGKMQKICHAFEFAIQSRARFIATTFSGAALVIAVQIIVSWYQGLPSIRFLDVNFESLWLIAIAVWLLPAKSGRLRDGLKQPSNPHREMKSHVTRQ